MGLQDRFLARFQYAVEPAEHDERQDDLAVLGLLEIAAKRFGDLPNEAGKPVGLLCSLVIHPDFAPDTPAECETAMPPPRLEVNYGRSTLTRIR